MCASESQGQQQIGYEPLPQKTKGYTLFQIFQMHFIAFISRFQQNLTKILIHINASGMMQTKILAYTPCSLCHLTVL